MKILVTGGSGFVGKAVIDLLTFGGYNFRILALTRNDSRNCPAKNDLEWFTCDLSDPATYREKINVFLPDIVVHLAWEGIPDFSFEKCNLNLQSALHFFNAVFEIESVQKIIAAGTCFEYNRANGICKESDICISKDYFTWSKNVIRDYLSVEAAKKNVVYGWARFFYVYGPHQRAGSLLPTILRDLNAGKTPDIRTPANANDFIYVGDVASGILALVKENISSGIYNLGSGESTPVLELCKIAERLINSSEILSVSLEERTIGISQTVNFKADIEKSASVLHWKASTTLEEGIQRMIGNI